VTDAPASIADSTLHCPRCGYNLTGLSTPRCPECGKVFDAAQLAAGYARENVATRLDGCDPWQPHQALCASLLELLHNAARPGRASRRITLDGPWWASAWILLGGLLWTWVIATAVIAVAVFIHERTSPGTAAKAAVFWIVPRLLLALAIPSALCALALTLSPHLPRKASWRQRLRIFACTSSGLLLLMAVPLLLLTATLPELALGPRGVSRAIPLLAALVCLMTFSPRRDFKREQARQAAALFWLVPAALSGAWPIWPLIPESLEPPVWVYFLDW
jgi:hypothetical protein